MKFVFLCIGKPHDASLKAAIDDFTQRAHRYYPVKWMILPPLKNAGQLSEAELKKKEGQMILDNLSSDDTLVALDERGKSYSSETLAKFIQSRANESCKQVVFLIGGAFGIDSAVMQKAKFHWSLSDLTFPHQLVRLILAEQIYRACTILRNEKYHHI